MKQNSSAEINETAIYHAIRDTIKKYGLCLCYKCDDEFRPIGNGNIHLGMVMYICKLYRDELESEEKNG